MTKWKQKLLSLLVFLHVQLTGSLVPDFDESHLESWRVERKNTRDEFFLNMKKPPYPCFFQWCPNFASTFIAGSVVGNYESCGCRCNSSSPSFLPTMQMCSSSAVAANFGGCNSYFDQANLLKRRPVDLTKAKPNYIMVSIPNTSNCVLEGEYFDYRGFQKRWRSIPSGFFKLTKAQGLNEKFILGWRNNTGVSAKLSGRIIRLNVTCNNFQRCGLLKASGTVTYYAPVSSSTSSTYTTASRSNMDSQVPFSSAVSSLITRTTSSSQPPPPMSSSLSSSSSSLLSSTSVVLSTSSAVLPSPSPSLVVSSFFHPALSQATRLPAMSAGVIEPTSQPELQSLSSFNFDGAHTSTAIVVQPIKPPKTTSMVSASPTGGSDPSGHDTQTGGSDNGVVIGAAVGGAVVLGAVVIIIIFVFQKRRRAGKSPEKEPKQVKNPVYGTSTNEIPLERSKGSQTRPSSAQDNQQQYQGLIIGKSNGAATYNCPEDDYDNCNVYQSLEKEKPGNPVYQSLIASQGKAAHTTVLPKHSPRTSVTGPPNSKAKLATAPPKSKPGATGNPYQNPVLISEPVYNVLEESDPDAGPSEPRPPSGHDNPAYEQTLEFNEPYAAVHRPAGSQRESFYEPLRGPTQDLYAPLG